MTIHCVASQNLSKIELNVKSEYNTIQLANVSDSLNVWEIGNSLSSSQMCTVRKHSFSGDLSMKLIVGKSKNTMRLNNRLVSQAFTDTEYTSILHHKALQNHEKLNSLIMDT